MKPGPSGSASAIDRSTSRPGPGKTNFPRIIARVPAWFWLGAILILTTLAAYSPVFSAGFIWDDDAYVTDNSLLTASNGLSRIWFSLHSQSQYFPLVFTTLRWEHDLWGLNPVGYHLVNICLHIVNALLIWALLRRLSLPGAWLAAAVFALHPVQVETVAWITELKNTESTVFYLLAVFAWLEFCAGQGRWFYVLALALHLLALFAKTTACTLPAVLLLALWLKDKTVSRQRIFQVLPFLLIGFGMGLLSVWWEKHLGNYQPNLHLLGGPLDRLLIATHALWFYAGKVFWPADLTFSYPRWDINASDWRQYLWPFLCLLTAATLWLSRRRLGRAWAGVIFFVAVLSPMLGFIPLYTFYFSYVADHYQYLACLGLIALAVAGAAKCAEASPAGRRLRMPLATMLLMVLAVLTWRQCGAYHDLETLWTDTLEKNPRCWMAHGNLGRLLVQQGKYDEAETHYRAALAIFADAETVHFNYGNLLARTGRPEDAIVQYQAALRLAPENPETHLNLGSVLNRLHRPDEAIVEYERAIACQPDLAVAYYNLGNALLAEHKMDAAVAAYQRAVQLSPDSELFRKRLQALTGSAN